MTNLREQAPPLTQLSEEEQLFRANVRAFAQAEIAPLVREMDEAAAIPRALIDQLFDLGVMAIQIPETFGGAGAHFFLVGHRRRGAVADRPVGGCPGGRAEHPGHQRAAEVGLG